MAESLILPQSTARKDIYETVLPQIRALIEDEPDMIANLANIAAVLKEAFGFFWVGFYVMREGELVLGPFQGPLACTRIRMGKGVCGTSAQQQKTLLVPDVDQFPGHIACSSDSRSEIVVPLIHDGECKMVLDVDSHLLDDFSAVDQHYLEEMMALVSATHYG
jgi:L-methionine (R)-S-oxide reductase